MATHAVIPAVELEQVTKTCGSIRALRSISLTVEPGEVAAILRAERARVDRREPQRAAGTRMCDAIVTACTCFVSDLCRAVPTMNAGDVHLGAGMETRG